MKHNWGGMWVKGKCLKIGSKESSKKEDSGQRKVGNCRAKPGSGISPEEEMAAHSSVLAQRIPWTEEPGEPQSMGSHRVRPD